MIKFHPPLCTPLIFNEERTTSPSQLLGNSPEFLHFNNEAQEARSSMSLQAKRSKPTKSIKDKSSNPKHHSKKFRSSNPITASSEGGFHHSANPAIMTNHSTEQDRFPGLIQRAPEQQRPRLMRLCHLRMVRPSQFPSIFSTSTFSMPLPSSSKQHSSFPVNLRLLLSPQMQPPHLSAFNSPSLTSSRNLSSSLRTLPPIFPGGNLLRLFNTRTTESLQSCSLSLQSKIIPHVIEMCSGDGFSFLDSRNCLVFPKRVSIFFGNSRSTRRILEGESGIYHFPLFNISTNQIRIHTFYGAVEFRFRCNCSPQPYQGPAIISPKDFYSLVLENEPSQACHILESIPLASRLPFVSFQNREGEAQLLGQTPLHVAARAGHVQLVQLLLDSGGSRDALNANKCSVLYLAALNGHQHVVDLLLVAGADRNAPANDGTTPLYAASFNGHQQVVELLLASGARINTPNQYGATPIYIASFNGHHRVVELLLAAGADFEIPINDAATPLFAASGQGHRQIVELFLAVGADKNAPANDGATPIWIASFNGHQHITELLLSACVDINAPMNDGRTPIYAASENGHQHVVELLLAAGAEKDAADIKGYTPLCVASQNRHQHVVILLLAAGADRSAKASLQMAQQRSLSHITALLSSPLPQSIIDQFRLRQAQLVLCLATLRLKHQEELANFIANTTLVC